MMKRYILGVLALLVPAAALAGTVQLPATGQTSCSDVGGRQVTCAGSGQDGELRIGTPWPSPRFVAAADGSLSDLGNGLYWSSNGNLMASRDPQFDTDDAADGKVTWQHALGYVAKLNGDNYLGHSDWRLPNVNELATLLNAQEKSSAAWLNSSGFADMKNAGYWTATTVSGKDGYAWVADMREGRLYYSNKASTNSQAMQFVLAVRGEDRSLPRTGQTKSSAPGDDGAVRAGVSWPTPRFTNIRNVVMKDNLTGLVWTRDANAPGPMECGPRRVKVWEDAFTYVKCLNNASYLGFKDWRLPNRNELRSLFDYGSSKNATDLRTIGFINVQSDKYWTSTSVAFNSFGWFLDFDNGFIDYRLKTSNYYVWPVRTGTD